MAARAPIRCHTQTDPIGLEGGLNLYGFAGGDPVSYCDPFGLDPCWLNTAVGRIVVDQVVADAAYTAISNAVEAGYRGNVNSDFRTRSEQNVFRQAKGNGAAEPGTSAHEAGTALDMHWNVPPEQQQILRRAMNAQGFTQTEAGEPWHFEHSTTAGHSRVRQAMIRRAEAVAPRPVDKADLPECKRRIS